MIYPKNPKGGLATLLNKYKHLKKKPIIILTFFIVFILIVGSGIGYLLYLKQNNYKQAQASNSISNAETCTPSLYDFSERGGINNSSAANNLTTGADSGDIDGDGFKDIVQTTYAGGLYLFKNNGSGGFDQSQIDVGARGKVKLADVNKDGKLDIGVSTYKYIWIFLNNGDGTFTKSLITDSNVLVNFQFADINSDNKVDIISLSNSIGIRLSRGDGTFENPQYLSPDTSIKDFSVADLDNDSKLDITTVRDSGATQILYNQGNGIFDEPINLENDSGQRIVTGNLFSNRQDILIVSDKAIFSYKNNGNKNFTKVLIDDKHALSESGVGKAIAIGDLDGDSKKDIVLINPATQGYFYKNNGDNTFTASPQFNTTSGFNELFISDINNDSILETVLFEGRQQNKIYTFNSQLSSPPYDNKTNITNTASSILKYGTTFAGNTFCGNYAPGNYGQKAASHIDGAAVHPSGNTFTISYWDESAHPQQILKDGDIIGSYGLTFGNYTGGTVISVNNQYVFSHGSYKAAKKTYTAKDSNGNDVTHYAYLSYQAIRRSDAITYKASDFDQTASRLGYEGFNFPAYTGHPNWWQSQYPNELVVDYDYVDTVDPNYKYVAPNFNIPAIASSDTHLFVANKDKDGQTYIKTYRLDSSDKGMTYLTQWKVDRPAKMVADKNNNLWVIQKSDSDNTAKVIKFNTQACINNPVSTDCTIPSTTISDIANPSALAIDPTNNQLLIGDQGPDLNIKIYNIYDSSNLPIVAAKAAEFGVKGGIYAGPNPGKEDIGDGSARLERMTDIGVDSSGNIYVNNSKTGVKSYSRNEQLNWKTQSYFFQNNVGVDPASDGADLYSSREKFKLDFSKPWGQEWSREATTYNPGKYPEERDLTGNAPLIRNINGKKLMYINGGSRATGDFVGIYKFNVGTDGEIAVPSGRIYSQVNTSLIIPSSQTKHVNAIWRDSNNNASVQSNEVTATNDAPSWNYKGSWVDNNGGIWVHVLANGIYYYPLQGFDEAENPIYTLESMRKFSKEEILPGDSYRGGPTYIIYNSEIDSLYIGTNVVSDPNNRHYIKYPHFLAGNRTPAWTIVEPFEPGFWNQAPMAQAGNYFFLSHKITESNIKVYDDETGVKIIDNLKHNMNTFHDINWIDMGDGGLRAFQRSNGEIDIHMEDIVFNKILIHRLNLPSSNITKINSTATGVVLNQPNPTATSPISINQGNNTITATGSVINGSVSKVEFYIDDFKIGEKTAPDTGDVYSLAFNTSNYLSLAPGVHKLTTKSYDQSNNLSGSSAPVSVAMQGDFSITSNTNLLFNLACDNNSPSIQSTISCGGSIPTGINPPSTNSLKLNIDGAPSESTCTFAAITSGNQNLLNQYSSGYNYTCSVPTGATAGTKSIKARLGDITLNTSINVSISLRGFDLSKDFNDLTCNNLFPKINNTITCSGNIPSGIYLPGTNGVASPLKLNIEGQAAVNCTVSTSNSSSSFSCPNLVVGNDTGLKKIQASLGDSTSADTGKSITINRDFATDDIGTPDCTPGTVKIGQTITCTRDYGNNINTPSAGTLKMNVEGQTIPTDCTFPANTTTYSCTINSEINNGTIGSNKKILYLFAGSTFTDTLAKVTINRDFATDDIGTPDCTPGTVKIGQTITCTRDYGNNINTPSAGTLKMNVEGQNSTNCTFANTSYTCILSDIGNELTTKQIQASFSTTGVFNYNNIGRSTQITNDFNLTNLGTPVCTQIAVKINETINCSGTITAGIILPSDGDVKFKVENQNDTSPCNIDSSNYTYTCNNLPVGLVLGLKKIQTSLKNSDYSNTEASIIVNRDFDITTDMTDLACTQIAVKINETINCSGSLGPNINAPNNLKLNVEGQEKKDCTFTSVVAGGYTYTCNNLPVGLVLGLKKIQTSLADSITNLIETGKTINITSDSIQSSSQQNSSSSPAPITTVSNVSKPDLILTSNSKIDGNLEITKESEEVAKGMLLSFKNIRLSDGSLSNGDKCVFVITSPDGTVNRASSITNNGTCAVTLLNSDLPLSNIVVNAATEDSVLTVSNPGKYSGYIEITKGASTYQSNKISWETGISGLSTLFRTVRTGGMLINIGGLVALISGITVLVLNRKNRLKVK